MPALVYVINRVYAIPSCVNLRNYGSRTVADDSASDVKVNISASESSAAPMPSDNSDSEPTEGSRARHRFQLQQKRASFDSTADSSGKVLQIVRALSNAAHHKLFSHNVQEMAVI